MYHPECFTCDKCNTVIQGKFFTTDDNKFLCEEDFLVMATIYEIHPPAGRQNYLSPTTPISQQNWRRGIFWKTSRAIFILRLCSIFPKKIREGGDLLNSLGNEVNDSLHHCSILGKPRPNTDLITSSFAGVEREVLEVLQADPRVKFESFG